MDRKSTGRTEALRLVLLGFSGVFATHAGICTVQRTSSRAFPWAGLRRHQCGCDPCWTHAAAGTRANSTSAHVFIELLGFIDLFLFPTRETTSWTVFVQERFGFWSAQLCLPEELTSRGLILFSTMTSPPVLSSTSTELVSLYSAGVLVRAFLFLKKVPSERSRKTTFWRFSATKLILHTFVFLLHLIFCYFTFVPKVEPVELDIEERPSPSSQKMTNRCCAGTCTLVIPYHRVLDPRNSGNFRFLDVKPFIRFIYLFKFSIANVIKQAGCPVPDYITGFKKIHR